MDCFVAFAPRNDDLTKMAGIFPGHLQLANACLTAAARYRAAGAAAAVPPLSSGVMRRMVTRRLMRLGPPVCTFSYCSP